MTLKLLPEAIVPVTNDLHLFTFRRGHDVFNQILPNKEEHVLMIRLSPIQKALYNRLIELTRDAYNDSLNPVKTFSLCCKVGDFHYLFIRLVPM